MEGMTDTVFRQIIASAGKPDVFFTEFTNVDAIWAARRGIIANAKLNFAVNNVSRMGHEVLRRLQYSEAERPIVAQIWGNTPKNYIEAVKLIIDLGFDGVDINMGCPVWGVVKKGECAGLINNPELAKQIIEAVKKAADQKIPVSVKTRIGYNKVITEEWIGFLLKQGLDAITVHGRTAKNRSDVPADWEEIGKAVTLRNKMGVKTAIIGNGDVKSREEAIEKWKKYGVDGVMIGRGILKNPFIFQRSNTSSTSNTSLKQRKLKLLIKHVRLFGKTYGNNRRFAIMKKFYKTYVNGFAGASKLRKELMGIKTAEETLNIINKLSEF